MKKVTVDGLADAVMDILDEYDREAGADVKLTNLPAAARYNFDENDPATYYYARQAMHHLLYTVANSKAMR